MTEDCWCCQLARGDLCQKKTRWYWLALDHNSEKPGIVVEDLNPKGYVKRLLYVPVQHVPCGAETFGFRWDAEEALFPIAKALEIEEGLRVVKWDMEDHSFRDHWHAQACLERVPDPSNEAWD